VSVGELHHSVSPGIVGEEWLRIGRAADVPLLEGRSVEVGERRIAVFRLADRWVAIDHACPHQGGPLSDGIVAEDCVICPLHNQRFSLSTGERQDGGGEGGVRTYGVRERHGALELRRADLEADTECAA
jgi:nitrite reductase (NADH) small subunit